MIMLKQWFYIQMVSSNTVPNRWISDIPFWLVFFASSGYSGRTHLGIYYILMPMLVPTSYVSYISIYPVVWNSMSQALGRLISMVGSLRGLLQHGMVSTQVSLLTIGWGSHLMRCHLTFSDISTLVPPPSKGHSTLSRLRSWQWGFHISLQLSELCVSELYT